MVVDNLIDQLRRDEGEVLHVYLDSMGIRTAGVGHNLESHHIDLPVGAPISKQQSEDWLREDVAEVSNQVHSLIPWSDGLDEPRRGVLLNMAFNLGIYGLLKFKNTLAMVRVGDYAGAARGMLASLWASQVGPRATRLAQQMQQGVWV
jgi:lysozyme